jgi:hypothetical protein
MPNNKSILAYLDVKDAFDRALGGNGIKLTFATDKQAHRFVGRANSFRYLDRKENLKIYPEPAATYHGRSVYDVLCITREGPIVKIFPLRLDQSIVSEL